MDQRRAQQRQFEAGRAETAKPEPTAASGLPRREFLSLGAKSVAAAGATCVLAGLPFAADPVHAAIAAITANTAKRISGKKRRRRRRRKNLPPIPRVNGGINIQPIRRFGPDQEPRDVDIIPEIVDLQMKALYELGFEHIRMTLGFADLGQNLLGAIPYVRAARALGIDILGLVGQFGFFHDLARALTDPEKRGPVLDGYLALYAGDVEPASKKIERAGELSFQILNEPSNFLGISPTDYVWRMLAPSYEHLKAQAPGLTVLSAAPIGEKRGVLRLHDMFGAGMERYCDVVGYHVYDRDIIPSLAGLAEKPVWVTETGASSPDLHLPWVREVYPEMRQAMPEIEKIFFFELFDRQPQHFRILDIDERESGEITSEVESAGLHAELAGNVAAATAGVRHARYEDLIPDITVYMPTDEDEAIALELVKR